MSGVLAEMIVPLGEAVVRSATGRVMTVSYAPIRFAGSDSRAKSEYGKIVLASRRDPP